MSTPDPDDTIIACLTRVERRLGIAESRRDLSSDRLSDRLAGVEHRSNDVLRAIENLRMDLVTRIDTRFDTLFGAIADLSRDFLNHTHRQDDE